MDYILCLFILFIILIDLLFYVPIKIHIYYDKNSFYFYIFAISILHIDNNKYINKFVNKIKIDELKKSKKDIKVLKEIKIKELKLSLKEEFAYKYPYIVYPLLALDGNLNFSYKIEEKNVIYIKIELLLINCLLELIKQRSKKNERTSN